jgi:hypothetical protein
MITPAVQEQERRCVRIAPVYVVEAEPLRKVDV